VPTKLVPLEMHKLLAMVTFIQSEVALIAL